MLSDVKIENIAMFPEEYSGFRMDRPSVTHEFGGISRNMAHIFSMLNGSRRGRRHQLLPGVSVLTII